jgi:hypothetical protein
MTVDPAETTRLLRPERMCTLAVDCPDQLTLKQQAEQIVGVADDQLLQDSKSPGLDGLVCQRVARKVQKQKTSDADPGSVASDCRA